MADYEPRRGTKGAVIAYTTADGSTRELRADDAGIVKPTDAAGQVALDALDLPVAHTASAKAKKKAPTQAKADKAPPLKAPAETKPADEAPAKAGKED